MKTFYGSFYFVLISIMIFGCNGANCKKAGNEDVNASDIDSCSVITERVLSILNDTRTTQYFLDEKVPLEDINVIIDAGRNAASGRNMQPWHFTGILNREVISDIAVVMHGERPAGDLNGDSKKRVKTGIADAPAAIVISCNENNAFDAGLACENMVIAATALGYGTKILGGGVDKLNEYETKLLLQIPDGMRVIKILVVGKADSTVDSSVDGVTGASTRKTLDEVSTIL